MQHSNQIREFLITSEGVQLEEVYVGPEGVLTGSMRAAQEARERAEALTRVRKSSTRSASSIGGAALEAQIASLRAEFEATEAEAARIAPRPRQARR